MNLDRLRALNTLATHGSVSAAASALHLTPSAVSQQLAKLERDVGQQLLERSGRGVRLTVAAQLLAEHAAQILSRVEAATADLEAHSGEVRGHVTLAAFPSAARGLAAPALRDLTKRFPNLTVRMCELEMDASLPRTLRGDADVALTNDWDEVPLTLPGGLTRAWLASDTFDVVLPTDHRLAHRRAVDLAELRDQPWIAWTKDSICYDLLVRTMQAKGFQPVIAHTAEEQATQMALVAAGLGAAVLPRIGQTILTEGLVAIPLQPALRRHTYCVWRTEATARPAIRAVVEALGRAGATARETQAA